MSFAGTFAGPRSFAGTRRIGLLALVVAAASSYKDAGAQIPVDTYAQGKAGLPIHPAIHPSIQAATASDTVHMIVGQSVVLTAIAPLRRVYVGNPSVLLTYPSGASEIVLTAKTVGVSSMILWDTVGGHRLYTVSADLDSDGLREALDEAFPGADSAGPKGSTIHAESIEGKVYLTGTVATEAASEAAFKLAAIYSKDVVNSLRIEPVHGKQVQLKLRIVEVDRTKLEQFGINIFAGGRTSMSTSTQQFSNTTTSTATGGVSSLSVSDPLNLFLYSAKLNVGVTVKDLEQRNILQVLAEPTLTTMSGLPARFLSGGEFPFPVVQGGTGNTTAISIQFRPYGVKVDFTPTVNADGSIRIKLAPEVSTLDYSNAVTISGFTIPALSTRRAETEVEIKDGESFVVSGLLDHRATDSLSKVPGISSIPILGQLFKSKGISHSVVELVVIVTATVVDPLTAQTGQHPNEPKFVVPNLDSDTFDATVHGKQKAGPAMAVPPASPVRSELP